MSPPGNIGDKSRAYNLMRSALPHSSPATSIAHVQTNIVPNSISKRAEDGADTLEYPLQASSQFSSHHPASYVTFEPPTQSAGTAPLAPTKLEIMRRVSGCRIHESHMQELNVLLDNVAVLSGNLSSPGDGARWNKIQVEMKYSEQHLYLCQAARCLGSDHQKADHRRTNTRRQKRRQNSSPQKKWIGTTRHNTLISVDHGGKWPSIIDSPQ